VSSIARDSHSGGAAPRRGAAHTSVRSRAAGKKGAHGGKMVSSVLKAIQGNICRCTGYVNIVEAIKAAAT
jgi:aerobic-type carbon monoxide dehydrogenase small subunit (CoxS/CutS family)